MTFDKLFDLLDVNRDGELSRSELHIASKRLGWHWHEAPILAVLDLLSILKPIPRSTFISYMNQIIEDPLGPYGKVLLNAEGGLDLVRLLPVLSVSYESQDQEWESRI